MLKELIYKNKTFRRFYEDIEIPYSQMRQWIEMVRLIPNARNQQALKYLIINDQDIKNQLFPTLKWAGYLKDWDGPEPGERPSAYIVIGIDRRISDNYIAHWTYVDLGIAIQTLLLAAVEDGYGGCVIVAMNKPKQREILQMPDFIDIQAVVALGKPKENVIWKDMQPGDNDIRYYRDEKGNHYVPKRPLSEILLNEWKEFKFIKNH